ncbi:hypothetical protein Y1Q_0000674 [Alligator mississippiensis]|uniref:DUF4537 domain-containing protein n=1 Tax=Alligator mississippiensis TaxID=8496 RepID=A0A151MC04_ALLMI|nr:hypothetical protein Y1Q_0000674 [Alligator mississippiensis]
MMTAHDKVSCTNFITHGYPFSSGSFITHPAWVTSSLSPVRCSWIRHCPCFPETICKGLMVLEKSMDFANVPVLARRESDGFYYQGTIKQEIKEESGMHLIEFAKPPALGEKYPAYVQKTSKDDILEYSHGMSHCILPGDKVLAPWEPDMVRYGPGTVVLGIETRDPLRASEDEEITVHFWNGKEVKVPLESDSEMYLTKSTMVDSAVNTDSSLFEKSMLKDAVKPQWRYWKRSHPKSLPRSPGICVPSNTWAKDKLKSKTICLEASPIAAINHSAMFQTTEQSPRRQLTMKKALIHQNFKPSLGAIPPLEKSGENQHCKSTCTDQQRKQQVLQQKEECERECQAEHRCHTALEINKVTEEQTGRWTGLEHKLLHDA